MVDIKKKTAAENVDRGNAHTQLVGVQASPGTMEVRLEVSQQTTAASTM